jgi:hypothetical protein
MVAAVEVGAGRQKDRLNSGRHGYFWLSWWPHRSPGERDCNARKQRALRGIAKSAGRLRSSDGISALTVYGRL